MNKPEKQILKLEELLQCYLYISSDDSLLEDTIDNIKSVLKDKINFDTDLKVFNGIEEINEEEFSGYVSTPSLFSSKKIAIVKHIEKMPVSLQNKVADLVSNGGSGSINIIFIATSLKQKFNPFLFDAIKKNGKVVILKQASIRSLRRWLDEKSNSDGIEFTEEAASMLIENVNLNLGLLKKEYEKLFNFISSEDKKIIDVDAVRFLVNRVYSLKIFDLIDYIGRRDKDRSLIALKSMLDDERNLSGLITLLHRMFKCFLYIKSEGGESKATNYIENNTKGSPNFIGSLVNRYIKFSDNFTQSEILKIFEILNKYNIAFRTGFAEEKNLAVKLISEITDVKIL